jgi:hypothetical protein
MADAHEEDPGNGRQRRTPWLERPLDLPPPMMLSFGQRIGAFIGCVAVIAACRASDGEPARVEVERAEAPASVSHRPAETLRQAVASLDTLYAGSPNASKTAVMKVVRNVRRGRLDAALEGLLPLLEGSDSAAAVAREMVGPLLLHHEAWGALTGGSEETNPLFAAFERAEPESWSFSPDSVVMPLEVTPVGTPTAEILVNGHPRRFWIDTGAGLTVVSTVTADEVGIALEEGTGRAATATTRSVVARPAVVRELSLGGVTVRNHPAIVVEAEDLTFEGPFPGGRIEIDGILGWPIIRKLDLTLDYAGGRLVLRKPKRREAPASNLFWLGYPTVAVLTEGGQELLLGLDTGARTTSLGPGYLDATGARAVGSRTREVGGAGGFESVEVGVLEAAVLRLDDWRIRLSNLDIAPVPIGGPVALAGVLGSDLGNLGVFHIDFLNGRFEFRRCGRLRP